MSAWWLLGFLMAQRAGELVLCRRNRRRLALRGGREWHPESYPIMVALHALFLLSLAVESYPWRIPLDLRITSYNVCYTKLLRYLPCGVVDGAARNGDQAFPVLD